MSDSRIGEFQRIITEVGREPLENEAPKVTRKNNAVTSKQARAARQTSSGYHKQHSNTAAPADSSETPSRHLGGGDEEPTDGTPRGALDDGDTQTAAISDAFSTIGAAPPPSSALSTENEITDDIWFSDLDDTKRSS